MTGTVIETAAGARVALSAAVDGLLSAPLEALASSEVTGLLEELEVARRRLDAVDARVLAEVEERRIAGDMGRTSVADLLSVRLRVGRGEARARTARARDLGPRRAVSGEPLEPIHAATATALAAGQINTGHVAVIAETLGHLPASIAAEAAGPAEDFLLTAAEHEEPGALRRTAQLLLARLDQDGLEPREELQQRRRGLTLHHCGDRIKVTGELTGEVAAIWEAVFDSLADPQPAKDSAGKTISDDRSPAQRRHDAFGDAGRRLLHSGSLPSTGGTPVTVLVRCTPEQLVDPDALLQTGHGRLLSTRQVLRIAGADTTLIPVSFDAHGEVLWCGRGGAAGHPGPAPRRRRPRRRVHLPVVHPARGLVPGASRHPLAPGRAHRHRQLGPGLRPPPPDARPRRLAGPDEPRPTRMAATTVA